MVLVCSLVGRREEICVTQQGLCDKVQLN